MNNLLNIIKANKKAAAPYKTQRAGKHWEWVIGIGKDHVAYLTMDDDAHKELLQQAPEPIQERIEGVLKDDNFYVITFAKNAKQLVRDMQDHSNQLEAQNRSLQQMVDSINQTNKILLDKLNKNSDATDELLIGAKSVVDRYIIKINNG